tara:strand:+ start:783 stop:998 length:216 start_codon:yes stop_codon:yes gene_type:complete
MLDMLSTPDDEEHEKAELEAQAVDPSTWEKRAEIGKYIVLLIVTFYLCYHSFFVLNFRPFLYFYIRLTGIY